VDKETKKLLWQDAIGWLKTIVFALIFAWFFVNYVIVNASVPTGSMRDTIREGDRVVAFRLSYLFSQPRRNDVVIFRGIETRRLYVKRIIGLPGETVRIADWRVYIDGIQQEEYFVQSLFDGRMPAAMHRNYPAIVAHMPHNDYVTVPEDGSPAYITVPEGHFFVLGDNRDNSVDSRGTGTPGTLSTFVSREQIQGRVIFRYWPGFQTFSR